MMERGAALAIALGCSGPGETACLRNPALTAEAIAGAQPPTIDAARRTLPASLSFAPNLDGVVLREDPLVTLARGDRDVPILVGSNADEARLFRIVGGGALPNVLTWWGFNQEVRNFLGDVQGDLAIPLYPHTDYPGLGGPNHALETAATDVIASCPTLSLAEATQGGQPTYGYHFTRSPEGLYGALGATHVVELFYVFGNWPRGYDPTADDLAIASGMQWAWSTFARGGAPWPRYTSAAPAFAMIDQPAWLASDPRAGRCSAMRQLGIVP